MRWSPVSSASAFATYAMIIRSSRVSFSGFMPDLPQICRKGLEHEAVTSSSWNSGHEFAGRMKSEYSHDAVISMSCVTIMSTFGLTLRRTLYAHLALLMMLTLVVQITLVGDGMCVLPVNTFRPVFGVSTISAWSPWLQYAGSSSLV